MMVGRSLRSGWSWGCFVFGLVKLAVCDTRDGCLVLGFWDRAQWFCKWVPRGWVALG